MTRRIYDTEGGTAKRLMGALMMSGYCIPFERPWPLFSSIHLGEGE